MKIETPDSNCKRKIDLQFTQHPQTVIACLLVQAPSPSRSRVRQPPPQNRVAALSRTGGGSPLPSRSRVLRDKPATQPRATSNDHHPTGGDQSTFMFTDQWHPVLQTIDLRHLHLI